MSTIALAQYEPGTKIDDTYKSQVGSSRNKLNDKIDDKVVDNAHDSQKSGFYSIPKSIWPNITFFGNVSAVIIYLALLFGFASFFIGYNAGGNLNKKKIFSSIITATIIGTLSRGLVIKVELYLFEFLTVKVQRLNN
jgi:hypothetical protein